MSGLRPKAIFGLQAKLIFLLICDLCFFHNSVNTRNLIFSILIWATFICGNKLDTGQKFGNANFTSL